MKTKAIVYSVFILLGIAVVACNPQVEIPSYIYVDSVSFSCLNTQGSASYNIKDISVTVNGDARGSYELPALVPVLHKGSCKIQLQPVIHLNGMSHQRVVNYTYSLYETYHDLVQGKIDTIRPHFTYADQTKFYFIEGFEEAGFKFSCEGATLNKTSDSSILLHIPNENNYSAGMITFGENDTSYSFELKTINPIYLTSTTMTICFLEINYSGTQSLEIGSYFHHSTGRSTQTAIVHINATEQRSTWRKVYVNLTEAINNAGLQMTHFDIYLKGYRESATSLDTFLLDNIKVVYM